VADLPLPLFGGSGTSDGTSDGEEDEGENDAAFGGVTSLSGTILFEMGTEIGGSSSSETSETADESLRNDWRFETVWGGGKVKVVETVDFEGTSPVGVLARGIF
jgi:hypothetical protein